MSVHDHTIYRARPLSQNCRYKLQTFISWPKLCFENVCKFVASIEYCRLVTKEQFLKHSSNMHAQCDDVPILYPPPSLLTRSLILDLFGIWIQIFTQSHKN